MTIDVVIHVNVSRTAKTLRRGVRAGENLVALLEEAVAVASFAVQNICASSTLEIEISQRLVREFITVVKRFPDASRAKTPATAEFWDGRPQDF